MEQLIEIAIQFGPLGLVVLGCFYYIIQKDKQHQAERQGLITTLENKEAIDAAGENVQFLS